MEEKEAANSGASLFGRSFELMDSDPLEEIFALNLGDFISEHLISDDLAKKIRFVFLALIQKKII